MHVFMFLGFNSLKEATSKPPYLALSVTRTVRF